MFEGPPIVSDLPPPFRICARCEAEISEIEAIHPIDWLTLCISVALSSSIRSMPTNARFSCVFESRGERFALLAMSLAFSIGLIEYAHAAYTEPDWIMTR